MKTLKEMLEQIYSLGLSDYEIARLVATNQSTIFRVRTGKANDASYQLGLRIERLYAERFSEAA